MKSNKHKGKSNEASNNPNAGIEQINTGSSKNLADRQGKREEKVVAARGANENKSGGRNGDQKPTNENQPAESTGGNRDRSNGDQSG
jgi:hypothetical protein